MSRLTIISQVLAYDDEDAVSNPSQKSVDWRRNIANLPVENPGTEKVSIEPFGSKIVFDGARALLIDNTTEFSIEASALEASRYRILNTSGTLPGFRLDRVLDLTGIELTLTVNPNLSMSVVAASGTPFSGVQPGDVVFIPGLTTGDPAGLFSTLNEGYWTVATASGTTLTISRDPSVVFSGISEVVTPGAAVEFQAFSASGVQVGDTVELLAGFASTSLHAYPIVAVNPKWIEITSTSPLGEESGIEPDASGFVIYTNAKRYLRLESDQECSVRLNGSLSDLQKATPWVPGDRRFPGEFEITGNVWKLQLVNKSSSPAAVLVITAE